MSDVADPEVDAMAALVAGAVMRRFIALMEEEEACTDTHDILPAAAFAFAAAAQVLRIVFASDEPLRALDEFEALEANLREAR